MAKQGHRLAHLDLLIASRIEAISPAVSKIMTLIRKTSCAPEHDFAVETALQEALANAVLHGNRLVMDEVRFERGGREIHMRKHGSALH